MNGSLCRSVRVCYFFWLLRDFYLHRWGFILGPDSMLDLKHITTVWLLLGNFTMMKWHYNSAFSLQNVFNWALARHLKWPSLLKSPNFTSTLKIRIKSVIDASVLGRSVNILIISSRPLASMSSKPISKNAIGLISGALQIEIAHVNGSLACLNQPMQKSRWGQFSFPVLSSKEFCCRIAFLTQFRVKCLFVHWCCSRKDSQNRLITYRVRSLTLNSQQTGY